MSEKKYDSDTWDEAREIYELSEESRRVLSALYEDDETPDKKPGVWGDLKGALETVRVRADINPVFEDVFGEPVAETPSQFLEQIEDVDGEELFGSDLAIGNDSASC